jgi:hypothetical protein
MAPAAVRQLVVVKSPGFHWALPAERVRQIVTGGAQGSLDVRVAAGLEPSVGETPRVLVAEVGKRQLTLKLDSPVELISFPGEALVPMPELAGGPKLRALVELIALGDETRPTAFVLSPRALEAAANARLPLPPDGDPR